MTKEFKPGMSIREYCDLHQMSFNQFSKLIPCSQPYIGMMDNFKANPSWEMAKRIEQITNGLVPKERWYSGENTLIGVDKEDIESIDILRDAFDE